MPKLFRKARGEHKETNVSQRATIAVKLTLQVSPSPESIWLSHPAALAQVTRKRLIPETVSKAAGAYVKRARLNLHQTTYPVAVWLSISALTGFNAEGACKYWMLQYKTTVLLEAEEGSEKDVEEQLHHAKAGGRCKSINLPLEPVHQQQERRPTGRVQTHLWIQFTSSMMTKEMASKTVPMTVAPMKSYCSKHWKMRTGAMRSCSFNKRAGCYVLQGLAAVIGE
eukprot:scaffold201843_cov18-Tisochrysis_lutea.AAC.1